LLQEIMIEANTSTNVIFFMICVFLKLFIWTYILII